MQHNNTANTHRSLCAMAIVFTIVTIRPVYSKFVLPSRKSLVLKKKKKNVRCPLIRVCSLIRSNTVFHLGTENCHSISGAKWEV